MRNNIDKKKSTPRYVEALKEDYKIIKKPLSYLIKAIILIIIILPILIIFITIETDKTLYQTRGRFGISDESIATYNFGYDKTISYTASIPKNYLKMFEKESEDYWQTLDGFELWAIYPTFQGYKQEQANIFKGKYPDNATIINIELLRAENINEKQLEKKYGQKGIDELIHANWKDAILAKHQTYQNLSEYVVPSESKEKKFVYESDNEIVRIECSMRKEFNQCSGIKRWKFSKIIIRYTFNDIFLNNFKYIDFKIDNLFGSFNIREKMTNK